MFAIRLGFFLRQLNPFFLPGMLGRPVRLPSVVTALLFAGLLERERQDLEFLVGPAGRAEEPPRPGGIGGGKLHPAQECALLVEDLVDWPLLASIVSSLAWRTSTVSAMVSAPVAYLFWVSNSSEEPSLRMRYKPGASDPGFPETS